jgi:hypothetical protein
MEIYEEKDLELIGAKVPMEFAQKFKAFCRKKYNQRILFHNIFKWWMDLPEATQEHIYRGRISEAHEQIAKEEARDVVARSKARSSKPQRTQANKRPKTV